MSCDVDVSKVEGSESRNEQRFCVRDRCPLWPQHLFHGEGRASSYRRDSNLRGIGRPESACLGSLLPSCQLLSRLDGNERAGVMGVVTRAASKHAGQPVT